MDVGISGAPISVSPFSQIVMLGCITAAAASAFIKISISEEYSKQAPIFTLALYRLLSNKFPVLIVIEELVVISQLFGVDSEACSHCETVPVWSPVKLILVLLLEQTAADNALKVPPTGSLIITCVATEGCAAQVPLVTHALNEVVWVSFSEVYVVKVLGILIQLVPSVENSQFVTKPVWPAKVNSSLSLFSQIVLPPVTVPGTVVASTVISIGIDLSTVQVSF